MLHKQPKKRLKKLKIIFDLENKYEKKKNEAEILRLSNENAEKEIHNSYLKIQLVTVLSIVLLLTGILFYIRLKNRKNKIIAEQRIKQLEGEQKLLAAQSVIIGQENERKRIAQELHDGIGVLLSTASIHFSNVEESSADEKTARLLNKANKLLKQAGGEVRKISHDMMPGVLSKFGLQEALEDIFENVEDTGGIGVDCDIELDEERLNENTEIILYRIVQEMAVAAATQDPRFQPVDETELDDLWFKDKKLCGVTAGASTPDWIVQNVINKIKEMGSNL